MIETIDTYNSSMPFKALWLYVLNLN